MLREEQFAAEDLDEADRIMRIAFGTFRGLPEPQASHGDAQYVRTRFLAAPESAWVAEVDGELVGSVFAACWGSFGFLGPLTVHPDHWDRRVGSLLLDPVMRAFERWTVRQAGLFTFASSAKHIGLYQKYGFWPRFLTTIMAKAPAATGEEHTLLSSAFGARQADLIEEVRGFTNEVFAGLDVEQEIRSAQVQGIGDTLVLRRGGRLAGVAVDAVFDSVSVATTYKKELEKQGIVFCSFSEAVQRCPELVRKYLGSVVPYSDNFFATLNSAVFSDGSFAYVPRGVRCPMEL